MCQGNQEKKTTESSVPDHLDSVNSSEDFKKYTAEIHSSFHNTHFECHIQQIMYEREYAANSAKLKALAADVAMYSGQRIVLYNAITSKTAGLKSGVWMSMTYVCDHTLKSKINEYVRACAMIKCTAIVYNKINKSMEKSNNELDIIRRGNTARVEAMRTHAAALKKTLRKVQSDINHYEAYKY